MKFSSKVRMSLAALLSVTSSNAFSVGTPSQRAFTLKTPTSFTTSPINTNRAVPLYSSTQETEPETESNDDIQRLKSMAAKLRAEASELEAKQARERADMAESAFKKLDRNGDGELDLEELKAALEKTFKMDVSEERVGQLMEAYDQSGDGKLQKEEFTGLEQMRNKLDALVRDEKEKARVATKQAQEESEISKAMEAQLELINDKPPTTTDKVVSVLPYLFPLMDSLVFGRFLLQNNDNPVVSALALAYTVYRSIPLSGFLAFFGLNVLSDNLSLNRLVRFNMRQAIFLDVALFIPGLLTALATAASSGLDLQFPPGIGELGSDAVFLTLVAALGYSVVSSLTGNTPDKIPFISNAVNNRTPSVEDFLDSEGRLDMNKLRGNSQTDEKKDDDDQKKD